MVVQTSMHMLTSMFAPIHVHILAGFNQYTELVECLEQVDMCTDMCSNMCIDAFIDMCTDISIDICMELCMDSCVNKDIAIP